MASPEVPGSDKVTEEPVKNVAEEVKEKATENDADKVTDTATATPTTTPVDETPTTATASTPIKNIIQRLRSKSTSPTRKGNTATTEEKPAEESVEEPPKKPGILSKFSSLLPTGNYSSCPRCNADGTLGDCKVCGWNGGFGGDS